MIINIDGIEIINEDDIKMRIFKKEQNEYYKYRIEIENQSFDFNTEDIDNLINIFKMVKDGCQ